MGNEIEGGDESIDDGWGLDGEETRLYVLCLAARSVC